KRAAGQQVVIPNNGTHAPPPGPAEPAENGAMKSSASPTPHDPPAAASVPLAIPELNGLAKPDAERPHLAPDPALYAVLGLSPSASDAEIQTNYRRQAARLLNS